MKLTGNRAKDALTYHEIQTREQECPYCENQDSVQMVRPESILRGKFYKPQIESYLFRSLNDIIFDVYSQSCMEFEEMSKNCLENVTPNYFSWAEIVEQIKPIVRERVQTDFYSYIDFKLQHHEITLSHYFKQREFQNRRKNPHTQKSSVSTQETMGGADQKLLSGLSGILCIEQAKIPKRQVESRQSVRPAYQISPCQSLKSEGKTKKFSQQHIGMKTPKDYDQPQIISEKDIKSPFRTKINAQPRKEEAANSSILQLKRLTKNIDQMVSPLIKSHQNNSKQTQNLNSPKVKSSFGSRGNFQYLKEFKKSIEKQISVINKNNEDPIYLGQQFDKNCDKKFSMNDVRNTYGLKVYKNPSKRNLKATDKLTSVPMTPKPLFVNDYESQQRFAIKSPRNQKTSTPQSPLMYRNGISTSSRNSHRNLSKNSNVSSGLSKSKKVKTKSSSKHILNKKQKQK